MAKETDEQKAEREQKEAEEANRKDAQGEVTSAAGGTTDAVAAGNVAASEAAGKVSREQAARASGENTPNPDKTRPADKANRDPQTPEPGKSKKFDVVDRFLDLSGYEKSDVIGHNDERRTVVTSNGGKYEVSPKGKKLRTLSGPATPAELEANEEAEDE